MNNREKNIWTGICITVIVLCGVLASLASAVPPPSDYDTDRILRAIRQVETGGCADPANAVGDGGRAIGPYQIHKAYWQDAVEYDRSIGGTYADCRNEAYARRVVLAYMSRYCKAWTDETVARIHNGGPKGHRKSATLPYWSKVAAELE
jgi:hypothetical protein